MKFGMHKTNKHKQNWTRCKVKFDGHFIDVAVLACLLHNIFHVGPIFDVVGLYKNVRLSHFLKLLSFTAKRMSLNARRMNRNTSRETTTRRAARV